MASCRRPSCAHSWRGRTCSHVVTPRSRSPGHAGGGDARCPDRGHTRGAHRRMGSRRGAGSAGGRAGIPGGRAHRAACADEELRCALGRAALARVVTEDADYTARAFESIYQQNYRAAHRATSLARQELRECALVQFREATAGTADTRGPAHRRSPRRSRAQRSRSADAPPRSAVESAAQEQRVELRMRVRLVGGDLVQVPRLEQGARFGIQSAASARCKRWLSSSTCSRTTCCATPRRPSSTSQACPSDVDPQVQRARHRHCRNGRRQQCIETHASAPRWRCSDRRAHRVGAVNSCRGAHRRSRNPPRPRRTARARPRGSQRRADDVDTRRRQARIRAHATQVLRVRLERHDAGEVAGAHERRGHPRRSSIPPRTPGRCRDRAAAR